MGSTQKEDHMEMGAFPDVFPAEISDCLKKPSRGGLGVWPGYFRVPPYGRSFPTRSMSSGRTHCRDCIPASPTLGSLEELVQSARREDSLVFIPTDNALYESDLNKQKATRYVVPVVCGIVVGCC